MAYVIYNRETTKFVRIMRNGYWQDAKFATEGAAKAAKTRLIAARKINHRHYAIAELSHFCANIEKSEVVKNLMSGKLVTQSVNTPLCCDVSSETYWSM
jgi:hypothetical protein